MTSPPAPNQRRTPRRSTARRRRARRPDVALAAPSLAASSRTRRRASAQAAMQRAADERGRAARAGRALVRRDAGVGGDDRDLLERQPELLGDDLREHGPAALAELGGADGGGGGAVGVEAHHRDRRRVRAGVGGRDRRSRCRGPRRSGQPSESVSSSRSAGQVGVDPALAGQDLLRRAGRRCAAAARARRSPAGRRPRRSAARPRGCPAARRSRAATLAGTVFVKAERDPHPDALEAGTARSSGSRAWRTRPGCCRCRRPSP